MTGECERCGEEKELTTIETIEIVKPHQESDLCDECIADVLVSQTVWRVKGK